MKQQTLNVENSNNRIPLFDQALLERFNEENKSPSIRVINQPVTRLNKQKQNDQTVVIRSELLLKQQASIFKGLSKDTLQQLLSKSVIRSVQNDEDIIYQGDEVEFLYIIIDGAIQVFRSSPDAKEATLCLLKAGDTFMESAMFMPGPSPVDVKAIQASKLLLIPASIVKQQVSDDGQLRVNVLRSIAKQYKNSIQQIDSIVNKLSVDRLGHYLLKESIEQNISSLNIELKSKKTMLASHLGMVPETFSRSLKKLKAMGIDVTPDKCFTVTLSESSALCRFCDKELAPSCPKYGSSVCNQRCSGK